MKEKLIRIFERTDKEYLTLSEIKKQLNISKKSDKKQLKTGQKRDDYAKKCADLSEALNSLISENYLVPDDCNRFYKGSLPNKKSLNACIMDLIAEKGSITINDLAKLKEYDASAIVNALKTLELEGKLYCENEHYIAFPSNFFITKIYCNKKGFKYIHVKNGILELNSPEYDAYLPYDTVVFAKVNKKVIPKKVLARENSQVVCEVIEDKNRKKIQVVGNNNFPVYLSLKSLDDQDLSINDFVIGTRILVDITTEEYEGRYKANYIETIGYKDDLDAELIAIGYNNGFRIHYTQEELEQVAKMPTEVSAEEMKNRKDFRSDTIFTIDGAHTKDMDDAVGLKKLENGNYLLNVSIAAVSHYIKPGSPLWNRAEQNTTSLYLIDSVSHMLHPKISNGICSLNPNVDRLTKSFLIEIDLSGNIINFQIIDSIINSKKKMTYEDVNVLLENDQIPESYENFVKDLLLMQELSTIIGERRRKKGALDFYSREIKYIFDEDKTVEDVSVTKQGQAQKLIENFMIITNEGTADYMLKLGLTFIYRNHEIPFKDKINEAIKIIKDVGYRLETAKNIDDPHVIQKLIQSLSSKEEFFIFSSLLLRSMQKAYYSTENRGHYALALAAYSQVTSPIRRFLDLVIQTILDNLDYFCDPNTDIEDIKKYLTRVCEHANIMERCADKAEYEANKLYMVDYINNHRDEEFDAYVADITPRYMIVKTPKLIEGIVYFTDIDDGNFAYNPNNKWLTNPTEKTRIIIGSKVKLRVKETDREHRIIYFYALSPTRIQEIILSRVKN